MRLRLCLALAAFALLAPAGRVHAGPLAYAFANNGQTLIRFDTSTPGSVTVVGNFSGATSFLSGLDFRPADGLLYGYNGVTNQLVTVNLATAQTTFVANPSTGSNTTDLGLDFNPMADRLRRAGAIADVCVLHFKPARNQFPGDGPDYYGAEVDGWIVYPWDPDLPLPAAR